MNNQSEIKAPQNRILKQGNHLILNPNYNEDDD